ncbi:hypothetical protein Lal_00036151 [Lupinus albus]|nr:hypothetical protein Lal_00036151 [Lupinus albus]
MTSNTNSENTHNIGFLCQLYSNQLTTTVSIPNFPQYWIHVPTLVPRKERERKEAEIASAENMEGERKKLPATMTRDDLYWLSHDQVALFKTFRGTASRCKQTINHAIPRIKQTNSMLYDFLLHLPWKERERKEAEIASAENMEGERKKLV